MAQRGHYQIALTIKLCSSSFSSTSSELQKIANKKIIAFELVSCEGGGAINSIKNLAPGSSLITFVRDNYEYLLALDTEIRSSAELIKETNPFLRFIHYLLVNPETNKLAIKTSANVKIFTSSIDQLKVYSALEIKEWQKKQLTEFTKFCTKVKAEMPQNKQIDEALKLLEDDYALSKWMDQFDTHRFQELWLINMAAHNNLVGIKKLLANGISAESQLIDGENVIWVAANSGNLNIIKFFDKVAIDIANKNGGTPLYMAAQAGYTDVVEFLLSKNADTKPVDADGMNAFAMACANGHLDIVKIFLAHKIEIEAVNKNGETPMFIAAREGRAEVVEFLLSKGANVNATNNNGHNALLPVIIKGHVSVAKVLIQANIDLDLQQQHDNMNALMLTSLANQLDIAKLLLAAGVNTERVIERNKKVVDLSPSVEIQKEIKLFAKSPIKYILTGNDHADSALAAFHRLEKLPHIKSKAALIEKIAKTEDCLAAQDTKLELDLNHICGANGTYWNDGEF